MRRVAARFNFSFAQAGNRLDPVVAIPPTLILNNIIPCPSGVSVQTDLICNLLSNLARCLFYRYLADEILDSDVVR
jgi:hypothetical protein